LASSSDREAKGGMRNFFPYANPNWPRKLLVKTGKSGATEKKPKKEQKGGTQRDQQKLWRK